MDYETTSFSLFSFLTRWPREQPLRGSLTHQEPPVHSICSPYSSYLYVFVLNAITNLYLIHMLSLLSTGFIYEILLTFLNFSTIMFKIESGTQEFRLAVWPDVQIVLRCPWQIWQLHRDDNLELNATGSLPPPVIIIISLVSQSKLGENVKQNILSTIIRHGFLCFSNCLFPRFRWNRSE